MVPFEVVLPSGVRAAAKCCITPACVRRRDILQEANFFRKLHEQYGKESLEYYGECSFQPAFNQVKQATQMARDFGWGPTLFIELGSPLMETWSSAGTQPVPVNDKELEDLRVIARQYDCFSSGPILLQKDNKYGHQYVRTKSGIRHVDFDTVVVMPPPTKSVLDYNCRLLLAQFAGLEGNDPRVNCSAAYSREIASLEMLSTAPQMKVSREQQEPTTMMEQTQERQRNEEKETDALKGATHSEKKEEEERKATRRVNHEKKAMEAHANQLQRDESRRRRGRYKDCRGKR
jgi:hypothetical protein